MNKVLLTTGALLALSAFAARLVTGHSSNEAKFDLYQRRQWCPARIRTDGEVRTTRRGYSR